MFMNTAHKTILAFEYRLKVLGIVRVRFLESIGVGSQTYNNWRFRGIPANRMEDISTKIGMTHNQLRSGEMVDNINNPELPISSESLRTCTKKTQKIIDELIRLDTSSSLPNSVQSAIETMLSLVDENVEAGDYPGLRKKGKQ